MFWDSGFSRQELADLFNDLPPRLLAVVKDLCGAIDFFIYIHELTTMKDRSACQKSERGGGGGFETLLFSTVHSIRSQSV